jgi:hypothetical protein
MTVGQMPQESPADPGGLSYAPATVRLRKWCHRITAAITSVANGNIPTGYEDEMGFHYGSPPAENETA